MTDERLPSLQLTDPETMRALAHPARLAIMEHLGPGVTVTATECAEVSGLSPSATSYHLRALARAGVIEEAPGRGDGRERRWRARYEGWRTDAGQDGDPKARAAERTLAEVALARENEMASEWFAGAASAPPEWYPVAAFMETTVVVTPEEMARLTEEIQALFKPYSRVRRPDPPPGAERVAVHLRVIPRLTGEDVKE